MTARQPICTSRQMKPDENSSGRAGAKGPKTVYMYHLHGVEIERRRTTTSMPMVLLYSRLPRQTIQAAFHVANTRLRERHHVS